MLTPLGGTGSRRRCIYPPAPLLITGRFFIRPLFIHFIHMQECLGRPKLQSEPAIRCEKSPICRCFCALAAVPDGQAQVSRPGRARAGSDPAGLYRPTDRPAALAADLSSQIGRERRHAQKRTASPITGRTKAPRSLLVNERNYASLGLTKLWSMRDAFHGAPRRTDRTRKTKHSDETIDFHYHVL